MDKILLLSTVVALLCYAAIAEADPADTAAAASGPSSPSMETTDVVRRVYRSGSAPPPALAPDMSDGSADYLVR